MQEARERYSAGHLKWAIREELLWDPDLATADVRVIVAEGVVTLSGQVETLAMRVAIETAAKRVVGVRGVNNEVVVALRSGRRSRVTAAELSGRGC